MTTDWNTYGGGHQKIYRGTATGTAVIAAGAAVSGSVDVSQFTDVSFRIVGTAWTGGSMAFQAAHLSTEGTFHPVCGSDGALSRLGVAQGSYYLAPAAVGAQHHLKFWSEDGAGGTVAQAAERVIRYCLKG